MEISNHMSVSESLFSSISKRHNRNKTISRGYYEPSRLCKVYQLDLTDPEIKNIPRAGVLFYTFINGELHVCFGKDAKSGDLTDFGGRKHVGESPIKCGIREGNEESRFAFSFLRANQIQGFYCLYSSNMLIIFIPVASPDDRDIRELTGINFSEKQFLNKTQVKAKAYNEVNDIVWLNESKLENLFSSRPTIQLFAKVRRFMYSCTELSQNISEMRKVLHSVISGETEHYENGQLERRVQNSLSAVGSERRFRGTEVRDNKLTQWLSVQEDHSNKFIYKTQSESIPRRFIPEARTLV